MNNIKSYFKNCSVDNLYRLEGTVPFFKAIPYSFEHAFLILLSNIMPILLILTNPLINQDQRLVTTSIQNALMLAGVGSLIQLFPIWKVGSKLPMFVGMNFAFMSIINYIGVTYGYNTIASSVIVGSIFFIIVSLFIKKVLRLIPQISRNLVILMLGLSLIITQVKSIPLTEKSFYTLTNFCLIIVVIGIYLLFTLCFKKKLKGIALISSIIIGFLFAIIFKIVDFSPIKNSSALTYPKMISIMNMEFNIYAIITVCVMFLVSFTDAICAVEMLNAETSKDEKASQMMRTSLGVGTISLISGFFGCIPLVPYAQNLSVTSKNKVVNRYTLGLAAIILILLSFFPIVSAFILSIPSLIISVINIIIFFGILITGFKLIKLMELNYKNIIIISTSVIVSLIFTFFPQIFSKAPKIIEAIMTNSIVVSFIISMILYYIIPSPKETR